MIDSADLVSRSRLAERYGPIITVRPAFISSPAGSPRMVKLEARIHRAEVVHTGPELVQICAELRVDCEAVGHPLAQREHNADRGIAATALRLGVPLVSNYGIFRAVPGLGLETVAAS